MQLNIGCKIKSKKKKLLCDAVNAKIFLDTFFCLKYYVRGYENNPKARQSITVIFIHLLMLTDYSLRFWRIFGTSVLLKHK